MTHEPSVSPIDYSIWNKQKLEQDLRPDFTPNIDLPRHGWFPFKEGFSASLVSYLLLHKVKRTSGQILDPFLGSGTTALEGSLWGWDTYGIEVNPFLAFVSRVKTEKEYDPDRLLQGARRACSKHVRTTTFRLPTNSTLVERPGLKKWLFNKEVAKRFQEHRSAICESAALERKYKDLLFLGLVRSMQDVANAKRDGKCWRYKKAWRYRDYGAADLDWAFRHHTKRYAKDLSHVRHLPGQSNVILGDSRLLSSIPDIPQGRLFDAVVTSPPYLNSFDYTDIYRPELLLMGAFRSSKDLRKLRLQTLRSHVQVAWPKTGTCPLEDLRRICDLVRRAEVWDRRIPEMIEAYFVDLDRVIGQCTKVLRPGGYLCFVVSNSAYGGIVVPVDELLTKIFERNGISVLEHRILRETRGNGYHQRRSKENLREALVVGQLLK